MSTTLAHAGGIPELISVLVPLVLVVVLLRQGARKRAAEDEHDADEKNADRGEPDGQAGGEGGRPRDGGVSS